MTGNTNWGGVLEQKMICVSPREEAFESFSGFSEAFTFHKLINFALTSFVNFGVKMNFGFLSATQVAVSTCRMRLELVGMVPGCSKSEKVTK